MVKIEYCDWEGVPALYIETETQAQGAVYYDHTKPPGWVEMPGSFIAAKAGIMGEERFKEKYPGIGLPDFILK